MRDTFLGIGVILLFVVGANSSPVSPTRPANAAQPVVDQPRPAPPDEQSSSTVVTSGARVTLASNGAPRLVRTVAITPDSSYRTGDFCRSNHVPSTDRLVVTFGTGDYTTFTGMGYAYREYTTDLTPTGISAYFLSYPQSRAAGDSASVMIGDDYYFLTGGPSGWRLHRFDAAWRPLAQIDVALDPTHERDNDQMLAFANGQLVASSLFHAANNRPDPRVGEATHHRFFSTDLRPLGRRVLDETPHVNGSSLVFVDGVYHLVSSTAFFGDLVVLRYDVDWRFLDAKTLRRQGQWPQGLSYDRGTFYVAYLDLSTPGTANVSLAAFDRDWNTLSDFAITRFTGAENRQGGRPWVMAHGDRLYVSYDVATFDPATRQENRDWQCQVAVFERSNAP